MYMKIERKVKGKNKHFKKYAACLGMTMTT